MSIGWRTIALSKGENRMAKISKPLMSGVNIAYDVKNEHDIQFLFAEEDASFSQQGSAIVIDFHDGSTITLYNFFASNPFIAFSDGSSYTTQSFIQENMENPIRTATNYLNEVPSHHTLTQSTPQYSFNASTDISSQQRQSNVGDDRLHVAPAAGPTPIYSSTSQQLSLDETMELARSRAQFTNLQTDEREFLRQQNTPSHFTHPTDDTFRQVMAENIHSGSNFMEVAVELGNSQYRTPLYSTTYSPQNIINPYIYIPQQRIQARYHTTQNPEYLEQ